MSSRGYSNRGDSFALLNEDINAVDHGEYFLKEALEDKKLPRGGILQIQQVVNVSAPKLEKKFYDPASHILKLTLTDGKTSCYGLITDLDKSSGISINTPPGSKIKVAEEIRNVYGSWVHLDKFNVTFIGGRVGPLIDKWTLQRKLEEKHEWGSMGHVEGSEGPPQWKPFGQKLDNTDVALLRKMKAMDIVNEKKEITEDDNSEFAAQRSEAISELMDKSTKQNWQKPKKTLVDKDVQDIMNEGFSMDQAEEAMARFKNPQKALKFLKGRSGQPIVEDREERKDRRKKPLDPDAEEDAPIPKEFQRPTQSISLFGFIQGHIKDEDKVEEKNEREPSYHDQYQSDYHDRGERGGRGGRRGGGFRGGSSHPRGRGRGAYDGGQDRSDRYDRGDQSNRDYGSRGGGGRYPREPSYRNDDSRGFFSNRGSGPPPSRGRDNYQQSYQAPQRSYNENLLNSASEYPPVGSQGPPRFQSGFARGGSGGPPNRGYGGESQRSYSRGDHHGPQGSVPYGGPQANHTYPGRPQTSSRDSRSYQYNNPRPNY